MPRSGKFFKNDRRKTAKNFSKTRMEEKVKFKDYVVAARVGGIDLMPPNQALQRMRKLVPLVESKDSGPHR